MPPKSEAKNLTGGPRKRSTTIQIRTEKMAYGLRIAIPENLEEDELLRALMKIPAKAFHLPEGGFVLDFQSRACSQDFIAKLLVNVIWKKKIPVLAWLSTNKESLERFRGSGFSVEEPKEQNDTNNNIIGQDAGADRPPATWFVYGSMRSGRIIDVEGDVVVWGHMNPGAEIVAGGSVVVAGRLQGLVHAGHSDREDAFILAGSFETGQARLGRRIVYAEEGSLGWGKSVLITLGGEEGALDIRENDFLPPKDPEERGHFLPFFGKARSQRKKAKSE